MLFLDIIERMILRDPGEPTGGANEDGADPDNESTEWMENQHAEGENEDEITVQRGEYNELHGFRKQFGKEYAHNKEDFDSRQGLDMDDHKSMKDFVDIVEENPKIYDVVKEMLAASREGREADFSSFTKAEMKQAKEAVENNEDSSDGKESKKDPEEEARLTRIEERQNKIEEDKLQNEFDDVYKDAISELKFLSGREKSALKKAVESEFMDDDKAYTVDDIEKVVKEQYSEIEAYRNELTNNHNKSLIDSDGGEPDSQHGNGASLPGHKYDATKATPHERVSQMAKEFREALS